MHFHFWGQRSRKNNVFTIDLFANEVGVGRAAAQKKQCSAGGGVPMESEVTLEAVYQYNTAYIEFVNVQLGM